MRKLLGASALTAMASLVLSAPADAQRRGGAPEAGIPAGSYQQSCRNEQLSGQYMTAECQAGGGRWAFSRLPYTQCRGADIHVVNGILACGAVTADSGRFVDAGPAPDRRDDRRDRRDDRRDDNGNALVGALAGAILGGALAQNGGVVAPPPPPPPVYGDPRYGDPRYDWRYQEGGYGYGRRSGEWVPIRDRADWLNRQIDRLQRDGRIDFRDARDYRRQLDRIEDRERDYERRRGLGRRERNDLDRRFSDLTEEIRHDARED